MDLLLLFVIDVLLRSGGGVMFWICFNWELNFFLFGKGFVIILEFWYEFICFGMVLFVDVGMEVFKEKLVVFFCWWGWGWI